MRVLIVNTSERTGGAAIAANRLMEALKKNGIRATMMVRDKQTSHITVTQKGGSIVMAIRFIWERILAFLYTGFSKKDLWQIDVASVGTKITDTDEFKRADVIHLHWVNQGYLSIKEIQRIIKSGKKVVITLHDMWYFTAVCHYSADCDKYIQECKQCPMLKGNFLWGDMAKKVFLRKKRAYRDNDITFVGCSKWMSERAKEAELTQGKNVVNIPNPINIELFKPIDKKKAKEGMKLPQDRTLILFGSQKITDERKGFRLLSQACEILREKYPIIAQNATVVVVGEQSEVMKDLIPLEVISVDYISDEKSMVMLYNAVDIYVTPSLQDNLPNTIMEAMACAIPCVGFNVGGIPEMIEHKKTGYVAEYKNPNDFAEGIAWTVNHENYQNLANCAREKVIKEYKEEHVARLYIDIYERNK